MSADSSGPADSRGKPPLSVDVVVPVLDEREMLPVFLERLDALGLPLNLIFVDNGSMDGTCEYLSARPGATLIAHGENLGYGRSLADGLAASTADAVIIIDADCEYPPEAIPSLLKALEHSSVVYASRFLAGGPVDMSWTRAAGNRWLTGLFNRIYRQDLTDLYTGMKALRREAFSGITFTNDGFEMVVELAAKISRRGLRISEVPVQYAPRRTGRSKMRHLPELMKAVRSLFYHRMPRHG